MQEKRYIFPMKVGNPQFDFSVNSRSQAIAVTASDDETARVPLEGAENARFQMGLSKHLWDWPQNYNYHGSLYGGN